VTAPVLLRFATFVRFRWSFNTPDNATGAYLFMVGCLSGATRFDFLRCTKGEIPQSSKHCFSTTRRPALCLGVVWAIYSTSKIPDLNFPAWAIPDNWTIFARTFNLHQRIPV
jgi:hypothetical protein